MKARVWSVPQDTRVWRCKSLLRRRRRTPCHGERERQESVDSRLCVLSVLRAYVGCTLTRLEWRERQSEWAGAAVEVLSLIHI